MAGAGLIFSGFDSRKLAGSLLVFGALQFIAAMLYSESIYPGYGRQDNFISDLGVGATATIFNSSAMIAGAGAIVVAFLLFRAFGNALFSALFALAGIGIFGVGSFPEGAAGFLHEIFSAMAFFFGALSAIASSRFAKPPLSRAFAALGIISLAAIPLFLLGITLGLGVGGMERAIVYPFLLWAVLFGAFLFSSKGDSA